MMQALPTRIRGPVAAIGDVHGQAEKLAVILERLQSLPDFDDRWIVFLGDLVDRGPDPRTVLEMVIALRRQHPRTTVVCGNHELAMGIALGWIPAPEGSDQGERWLEVYDSETTFESYGASFGDLDDLRARTPRNHRNLIAGLPWCVEHPDYLFVHAGVDANSPIESQIRLLRQRDYSMDRPMWLCSHRLAMSLLVPVDTRTTIVTGHVRVPQVVCTNRRIQLDTTGGLEGNLSCVLLPEKRVLTSGPELAASRNRSVWRMLRG